MTGARDIIGRVIGFGPVRIIAGTFRRFRGKRAGQMAASLSFQTLVSCIPVLLFMAWVLRRLLPGMPEGDVLAFLSQYLVPGVAERLSAQVFRIVNEFDFTALGWAGAIGTFMATYMLVLNLKICLNDLGFRSSRSGFFRRLGWVTLVVVFVPPLVWLIAYEGRGFARLPSFMSLLRPFVSTAGMLFLVYRLLPDRGPSSGATVIAATVVALALEIEKVGLAMYAARFEGVYEIIYGTLLFLPLVLAWIYISWCLLLMGAALAASIDDVTGIRRPTSAPPPAGRTT